VVEALVVMPDQRSRLLLVAVEILRSAALVRVLTH
jgi:hypothetical protein